MLTALDRLTIYSVLCTRVQDASRNLIDAHFRHERDHHRDLD